MSRFALFIDLDNAAFGDEPGPEVARILDALATRLRRGIYGPLEVGDTGVVMDVNGNAAGHWLVQSSLKTYRVGNVYEFEAEDAEHAVEQYHDAIANVVTSGLDPDVTLIEEVER